MFLRIEIMTYKGIKHLPALREKSGAGGRGATRSSKSDEEEDIELVEAWSKAESAEDVDAEVAWLIFA